MVPAFSTDFTLETRASTPDLKSYVLYSNTNLTDFSGMHGDAPGWTGLRKKSEAAEPFDAQIALHSQNPSSDNGFQPRNIDLNREQDVMSKWRQAMPANLPSATLSLFEEDGSTVRSAVCDWLTIRYRDEKGYTERLSNEEAKNLIHEKGITYNNIWFWDPKNPSKLNGEILLLEFDERGRPINPFPGGSDILMQDLGFYFFYGENPAVDPVLTFEHNGKMYLLVVQKQVTGNNADHSPKQIAFPGGMLDIEQTSTTPLMKILEELKEETGIELKTDVATDSNLVRLVSNDVVAGEPRTTRNAWTTSMLYHIHFNSLDEMVNSLADIHDIQDSNEIAGRYCLDVRYVLDQYVINQSPDHAMMASHGQMLTKTLKDFFTNHEEKLDLLKTDDYSADFNTSRIKGSDLNKEIQQRMAQPPQRSAAAFAEDA